MTQPNLHANIADIDDGVTGERDSSDPIVAGRYQVIERIGSGGMGVVHLALDTQLGRNVALKRMAKDGDAVRTKRMVREAHAMARLDHPNVVRIYDADTSDGQFFIAMEYVDGVNLASWLDQPRSVADIVSVFHQAGRGLAEAHRRAIVHRDFKPQNVLIAKTGEAKVTDFGLARAISAAAPEFLKQRLTAMGDVPGTPRYMAPEQRLRGAADARSDMFSFALTLAEALGLESSLRRARAGTRGGGHVRDELSTLGVPSELIDIIERALRADPAERFGSMDELLDSLDLHDKPRSIKNVVPKPQQANHSASPSPPPRLSPPERPRQIDQAISPAPIIAGQGPQPPATPSRRPLLIGAALALVTIVVTISAIATSEDKDDIKQAQEEPTSSPPVDGLAQAASQINENNNGQSPISSLTDVSDVGSSAPTHPGATSSPPNKAITAGLSARFERRYLVTRRTDSDCPRLSCSSNAQAQTTKTSRFCVKNGKYSGPHERLLADGTTKALRYYEAGKPEGRSYSFSAKTGRLEQIDHYADGKRNGLQFSCDSSGNAKSVSTFIANVRSGAQIRWNPDGTVRSVSEYHNGKQVGVFDEGDQNPSTETREQMISRLGWEAPRNVCRPAKCLP